MTIEELILFHLDTMGGRLNAMIKEVRHDILAEGRYLNQDVQLTLDIMSAIRKLEEKGIIKQIMYQEMDDNQKYISDHEGEEFYTKIDISKL